MQVKTPHTANLCLIAAFSLFGLVACNNSDYKTSDSDHAADTSNIANSSSPAVDNTADKSLKDTAAMSAGVVKTAKAKRKGRASTMMPEGNVDRSGTKSQMMKDDQGVYSVVQVMPEFPGGQNALANYINNHVEYPQQAIDNDATGTVKVSFVVDENGKVTNAHLLNGGKLGKGLDEEALRVISGMPSWKPGKVKGKNVKTRLELPINFQFEA